MLAELLTLAELLKLAGLFMLSELLKSTAPAASARRRAARWSPTR